MSKSIKRVLAALEMHGIVPDIHEVGQARTAQEAADAVGCHLDQIAKSILFAAADDPHRLVLFLTAGGNLVDGDKAGTISGTALQRADAQAVRRVTGFAIGGVAPLGHLTPPVAYFDPRLLEFDVVWAAAGTPRHVFPIAPKTLLELTGAQEGHFV